MQDIKVDNIQQTVHHMIDVEEMIKALQALPAGSKLCITQEGHYAQGHFADISLPGPVLLVEEVSDSDFTVYSIGHSDQNY